MPQAEQRDGLERAARVEGVFGPEFGILVLSHLRRCPGR
jgi:hypothetical protein